MIPIRDSQTNYSKPVVTAVLIAINVFVFLFQRSLDPYSQRDFTFMFGFIPDNFAWANIFTSMFMHGGWMHLIGNMLFLWVFGDNVEDILGRGKYLLFYVLCGVAAALAQFAINPDSRVPMVGASGAIFGVMGAYALKFPHSRIVMIGWMLFVFTFEVPAWLVMLYFIVFQFIEGFSSIGDVFAQTGGTAFFAHIGGFFAGMALIFLLKTRDRYHDRRDLTW
jgi:membrane associated rhomboid family serine protease